MAHQNKNFILNTKIFRFDFVIDSSQYFNLNLNCVKMFSHQSLICAVHLFPNLYVFSELKHC